MATETENLKQRFERMWKETLNKTTVQPPNMQQVLGFVLVILDHDEGTRFWSDINDAVEKAFSPFLGKEGKELWKEYEAIAESKQKLELPKRRRRKDGG